LPILRRGAENGGWTDQDQLLVVRMG